MKTQVGEIISLYDPLHSTQSCGRVSAMCSIDGPVKQLLVARPPLQGSIIEIFHLGVELEVHFTNQVAQQGQQ
jgi:hypothetical protein